MEPGAPARLQFGGAGGAPTNNVIASIRKSERYRDARLIGTSSEPADLFLADVQERVVLPKALDSAYPRALIATLHRHRPQFIHAQNDYEVRAISRIRNQVVAAGTAVFLPSANVVEDCIDKFRSYQIWEKAGLTVPATRLLHNAQDLDSSIRDLGPTIWLRATTGGGGAGALPTNDTEFGTRWVERLNGWGRFTGSRLLTPRSVTWMSLWHDGHLVVAQGRRRWSWGFADRTLSGVTGVTTVAETVADAQVDRIAEQAIRAIDTNPNGLYGVDMTYDNDGVPNPTEINIGRFFTTIHFFTVAGLNIPEMYLDIGLHGKRPILERRVNPLPSGLVWIRGMDVAPVLTSVKELEGLANTRGIPDG